MPEPSIDQVAIREALPADAATLADAIETINAETEFLGIRGARVPWAENAEERMREMREKGTGIYLVAVHAGEIIGFLGAFPGQLERTRGVIFIAHVGIREAFRGRGIGARLFAAVEAWARERGARRLELRVSEANTRGQALYRKRGFMPEGRIVDAAFRDGRYQADLWMANVTRAERGPRWDMIEVPAQPTRRRLADLVIRAPTPEDAAMVQAWERALLTGSPIHLKQASEVSSLADLTKYLAESSADPSRFMRAALVNEAGELRIVGYATGWIVRGYRSEHDGMFGLNVLPEFSGCDVGRGLAEALESWAQDARLHRLSTWTQAHNARGLRFAARLGFRQEAIAPNYAVIEGRVAAQVSLGKLLT